MDEEMASNLRLGMETQGTADEVDSSAIRPAPAPTAEELQHSSVDVSSSQPLDSRLEGLVDNSGISVDDRIDSVPNEANVDAIHGEAFEEIILDEALNYSDDAGSQSPATRTLELPPILDLSQSQGNTNTSEAVTDN